MVSETHPIRSDGIRIRRPIPSQPAALLLTGSSFEVLETIARGDPLELRARIVRRLRRNAYLFDVDWLLCRTQAIAAQRSLRWRGDPELPRFLQGCITEAFELVSPTCQAGHEDSAFNLLSKQLALAPGALRSACERLNGAPTTDRQLFLSVVLGAAPPQVAADRAGLALLEAHRRLQGLLDRISAQGVSEDGHQRRLLLGLHLLREEQYGATREVAGQTARGRSELRGILRRETLQLLEGLAHHVLLVLLDPDSFLRIQEPSIPWERGWARLEELRREVRGLPAVPHPGETPLGSFRRLEIALRQHGARPELLARMSALRIHAEGGGLRVLSTWKRLVRSQLGENPQVPGELLAALRGWCAALLDKGDVRGVRDVALEYVEAFGSDDELTWRQAWAELLCGEVDRARERTRGLVHPRGALPSALCVLRERFPEWAPLLPGRAGASARGSSAPVSELSRADVSASVLAVFALDRNERLSVLRIDASPGLGERPLERAWEREGAWRRVAEPEHELFARAHIVRRYAQGSAPRSRVSLRGRLGCEASRALALAPVRDECGEVCGWLHLECEHWLLPSEGRLGALARSVAPTILRHLDRPQAVPAQAPERSHQSSSAVKSRTARGLLEALGLRLARRRLSLVELVERGGDVRIVAAVGGVLHDVPEDAGDVRGGGRALRRARRTGGIVRFDDPDPNMGLHSQASSGSVVPLGDVGGVPAFLVCESLRRADHPLLGARFEGKRERFFQDWHAVVFRDWYARRFGWSPAFDPRTCYWSSQVESFRGFARARTPLFVEGPTGAGKEFVARYLLFESGQREARIVRATRLESVSEGRGEPGHEQRLIVLSRDPVDSLLEGGRLSRALAETLRRSAISVAPLAERRDEIPGLVRAMAARFAESEGREVPRFSGDALALLWRQPWRENVRALEGFIYKLVLSTEGEIGSTLLQQRAASMGLALRRRLPSKRPRRLDLEAALLSSRNKNGSVNKTRAARLLGWDPDTLARHLGPGGPSGD